jgi:hypothetical protein
MLPRFSNAVLYHQPKGLPFENLKERCATKESNTPWEISLLDCIFGTRWTAEQAQIAVCRPSSTSSNGRRKAMGGRTQNAYSLYRLPDPVVRHTGRADRNGRIQSFFRCLYEGMTDHEFRG